MLPNVREDRQHVGMLRELVDAAIRLERSGALGAAVMAAAESSQYLAEYVEQMPHANVQTAKRLAREVRRLEGMDERIVAGGRA